MPAGLREVLRTYPARDHWASFTAAQAYAAAGFRVLPCQPGGKRPVISDRFRHGAKSATSDREAVRDAFIGNPGSNVGVAVDHHFVVVDVDVRNGGTLEAADRLGLPVDGYRERSGGGGFHLPLVMPSGFPASRSTILAPGIEVKAAGSYVISPHSRLAGAGWYQVEPDRDVWHWPSISPNWEYLHRLTKTMAPRVTTLGASDEERKLVRKVLHDLARGKYAHNIQLLLAGQWEQVRGDDGTRRYPSQSEADLSLMSMCVFGAMGNPRVLDSAMRQTRLFRPKWDVRSSANGETYGEMTIGKALASSRWQNRAQIASTREIGGLVSVGQTILDGLNPDGSETSSHSLCLLLGHFCLEEVKNRVNSTLLAFLLAVEKTNPNSPFSRPEGWVRLPVSDLANHLGCDRKTIARALAKLAAAGIIERRSVVTRISGSPRKDSLVRFTEVGS